MADGSLSQEEIDALLSGATPPGFGGDDSSGGGDSGGGGDLGGFDMGDLDALAGGGGDDGGIDMGGPSSDAIAAALGQGFSPPPPKPSPSKSSMGGMGGGMGNTSNLNLLMDVTLSLTVELGRTNMLIKDVLALTEGTVVELDKAIGEDLDLLANGKLIGRGKIIVIDDYYGVQITHIINPMERLSLLS
ncbi:MAG: flagellar motor switch protein FliN [Leptospiraceae bacterium]|nr:flagellar motor switch protein FliN [Leptospiraceae bacterium]